MKAIADWIPPLLGLLGVGGEARNSSAVQVQAGLGTDGINTSQPASSKPRAGQSNQSMNLRSWNSPPDRPEP